MNVDFASYPLPLNLALFATAAVFVWIAGTKLARYADAIRARTALSAALLGMVLLGVATSLPELATTVTAALLGKAIRCPCSASASRQWSWRAATC